MRAIRVHAPGDADAMVLDEVPDPRPGPEEAVVRRCKNLYLMQRRNVVNPSSGLISLHWHLPWVYSFGYYFHTGSR